MRVAAGKGEDAARTTACAASRLEPRLQPLPVRGEDRAPVAFAQHDRRLGRVERRPGATSRSGYSIGPRPALAALRQVDEVVLRHGVVGEQARAKPVRGLKNPSICNGCRSPSGSLSATSTRLIMPPRLPLRYQVSVASPRHRPRNIGNRNVAVTGWSDSLASVIRRSNSLTAPGAHSTVAASFACACRKTNRFPRQTLALFERPVLGCEQTPVHAHVEDGHRPRTQVPAQDRRLESCAHRRPGPASKTAWSTPLRTAAAGTSAVACE